MKNINLHNNRTRVSLFAVFILAGGLVTSIIASQQNQEQRTRAATATVSVQTQCSTAGKVQFAVSFKNPETYAVDLNVFDADDTIDEEYENIAPGQTKTEVVATTKTSVPAGSMLFNWSPTDNNSTADGGDQNISYNALTCGSSTTPSLSSSPTSGISPTQPPIPSGKKAAADINDDGFVNQVDYNLFLREIATQPGQ